MTVRTISCTILTMLLFCEFPLSAEAATLTVIPTPDTDCSDNECDLQSALNFAASNGTGDVLNLQENTYSSDSTFTYNSEEEYSLILSGQGVNTILDGQGTHLVISLDSDAGTPVDINISDMTIRGGRAAYAHEGAGLAVYIYRGNVNIDNCYFTDNIAAFNGGGAYLNMDEFGYGSASVTNSTFEENGAYQGGGLYINFSNINLQGNSFITNALTSLDDGDGGGACLVSSTGTVTVTGNEFTDNGTPNGENCRGGGLRMDLGGIETTVIQGNAFHQNKLGDDGFGGGLYVDKFDGPVRLIGNIFSQNSIGDEVNGSGGGGLYIETWGSSGDVTAVNNVIVNNSAGWEAGGADFEVEMGLTTFNNNTVASNTSAYGYDVLLNIAGGDVSNNILWDGSLGDLYIASFYDSGISVDLLNNIIESFNKSVWVSTAGSSGNLMGIDPLINTSVTPTDYHLPFNSPAVDTGDNDAPGLYFVTKDVDGIDDRILDGGSGGAVVDIGADEYGSPPPDCSADGVCNPECPPGFDPDCDSSSSCWDVQVVDDGVQSVAITLDSNDNIHICYFAPSSDAMGEPFVLRHATLQYGSSEAWIMTTVATLQTPGNNCSIAVGTDDIVQIVYLADESIRYAWGTPDSGFSLLDLGLDVLFVHTSKECSIAVDDENEPHISFSAVIEDYPNRAHGLIYKKGPQGNPDLKTVVQESNEDSFYRFNEIELKGNSAPSIAYNGIIYDYITNTSGVLTLDSGNWLPDENVVHSTIAGGSITYEITPVGVYLAAINNALGNIEIFHNDQNKLIFENISFNGQDRPIRSKYLYLSLATDSLNNPHLVYYSDPFEVEENRGIGGVRYLSVDMDLLATVNMWAPYTTIRADVFYQSTVEIESGGEVGKSADLSLDSGDNPHIVYLDEDNGKIKYAFRNPLACQGLAVSPLRWLFSPSTIYEKSSSLRPFFVTNYGDTDISIQSITFDSDPPSAWKIEDCVADVSAIPPLQDPMILSAGEISVFCVAYDDSVGYAEGEMTVNSSAGTISVDLRADPEASSETNCSGCGMTISTPTDSARFTALHIAVLATLLLLCKRYLLIRSRPQGIANLGARRHKDPS